ncbi:MAG: hypothetical protein DMD47_10730 [Gemmatimonadetes bacterium]|nr:MAG: hypothetical protein DMD47_10730 [Gemmatimonadota bacterium]
MLAIVVVTPEMVIWVTPTSAAVNPCWLAYVTVAVRFPDPPFLIEVSAKNWFVVLSQTARYPMLPELSSMMSTFGVTMVEMKGGMPE